MSFALRSAVALLLLSVLAGCSSPPDSEQPQVIQQDAATDTGSAVADSPAPAEADRDDAPGRDEVESTAPGDLTAELQPDGTILVEGAQATFLMPSHNVACVVQPDHAVCQIDGKQYAARQQDINPEAFAGCTPELADAMSVGGGADPTWACLPYDIRPRTGVDAGGSWAGPGLGATDTLGGTTVAVLPYGTTLRLGNMSCLSDRAGVDCTDLTTGRGFQLARETYRTH